MIEKFELKNGGALTISSESDIPTLSKQTNKGDLFCLLSAKRKYEENEADYALVKSIIQMGAKYFCTFGKHCSANHDFIDPLLVECGDLEVMTTWHEDDADEDIAYFFINTVLLDFSPSGYGYKWLAVLDSSSEQDRNIKNLLLRNTIDNE